MGIASSEAEGPVTATAPGEDRLHRLLLGAGAALPVHHADVMHAQLVLGLRKQLHQHRGAVHAAGEHDERSHCRNNSLAWG
jgi:hypothetical protein